MNPNKALWEKGDFTKIAGAMRERVGENTHPLGQIFYAASCTICTPNSLSQEVGLGLGAQAGEKRLAAACREAGFSQVRRAAETPTNMVLEVTG